MKHLLSKTTLSLLLFLAAFSFNAMAQQAIESRPESSGEIKQNLKPLEQLLNSNGTINRNAKAIGSFDVSSYEMSYGKNGEPVFTQKAKESSASDDGSWSDQFPGPPGTDGLVPGNIPVHAIVKDASNNIYIGGYFKIIAGVAAKNIAKWDGTAWSALGNGVTGDVYSIALDKSGNVYAGGMFFSAGSVPAYYIAKWDGTAWSALGSGMNSFVHTLAIDENDNVYAGGIFTTAGGVTNTKYIAKWNGTEWSALGTGMSGAVGSIAIDGNGIVYAGGYFLTASGVTNTKYIAKWDGTVWSALGTGMASFVRTLAIDQSNNVYAGGDFTAAGAVTVNRIAKWDGTEWSALDTGVDNTVHSLSIDGSGNVYVGGNFTSAGGITVNKIAKWNGTAWSAMSTGMNDGPVSTIAIVGSGSVYAGGWFTTAGGVAANYIAKWDGTAWLALYHSKGMSNYINALSIDGSGNVYAGGGFTTAGGVSANRIAKWNGTVWSAMGTGLNNYVNALAIDGTGNVYAGGSFTSAGGVTVNRIAKWDGTAWSALGTGMNNTVNALATDGSGNVYAGGNFTSADGVANTKYIAKWNGLVWSALGTGMNNSVSALAIDRSGNVYAGGYFTSADGVANTKYIAKWNGTAWSALGNGMNSYVFALAIDGSSNVYAGGYFTSAGEGTANKMAKWNGTAWSAMSTGIVDTSVKALAIDGSGNVYAGGGFTTTGEVAANRMAKWNGTAWSAMGTGIDGWINSLAIDGSGNVYGGGDFLFAGGKNSSYFAKYTATSAFSGGTGTEANPYQIATLADLVTLSTTSSYWAEGKYFIQTADIDASSTSTMNSNGSGGYYGFSPIGNGSSNFNGNYDGQGHTISALYINHPITSYYGLFGRTSSVSILSNIKLTNCNITGHNYVGALAGTVYGTVSNCSSSGTVSGSGNGIGGLVGNSDIDANFTNCNSACIVTVSGVCENIGGLFGVFKGSATNCYSTGAVNASLSSYVGGFAGDCQDLTISNCFSTSNVSGMNQIGGFAGLIQLTTNITNSYATGTVTGNMYIGGFVGYILITGAISKCYSHAVVNGTSNVSGFIGRKGSGTITDCYFDADIDGLAGTIAGTSYNSAIGKTTAQMKTQATFTGWDFATTPIWNIDTYNSGYPYLEWQEFSAMSTVTVATDTDASTISNSETSDVTVTGTNTILTVNTAKTVNNITVDPRAKLDLTNTLSVTGDLTLKADESGTFNAKIGAGVTLGASSLLKFIKTMLDSKWYFVSFPCTVNINEISQLGGGNFVLGTDWYIKYYNGLTRATNKGGANWVEITDQNGTLTANKGYIIGLKSGVGTKQLSFVLDKAIVQSAENEARTVGVSVYDATAGTHAGWNLIGQPFLSRFNGSQIGSAPSAVTLPDAVTGKTYTQMSTSAASFEPFSAYFVQVGKDGNLSFATAGRLSAPAAVATDLSDRVQLNFTSATGIDNTNLIMNNDQTSAYQIGEDLEKWIGTGTDKPQIYTQLGGVNYGFNALPMTEVQNLPVGIYTKTAGITTISADAAQAPSLSKLLLLDKLNGTVTDLMTTNYSFTSDAGTNNTRFTITAQRVPTGNEIIDINVDANISIVNGKLMLQNIAPSTVVRIYDALGRLVVNKTANSSTMEIKLVVKGIYSIQMQNGTNTLAKKVIF